MSGTRRFLFQKCFLNYSFLEKLSLINDAYFGLFSVDCPGTESENAGKADACAGCPNQNICASAKSKEPDPGSF